MSWLGGIGPVDWAPIFGYCFWLGISDNTAFVHNSLPGLALKNRISSNPCRILLVKFNGRRWFGWICGGIDLGIGENLSGKLVEKTMDLTIWTPSYSQILLDVFRAFCLKLCNGIRWRWVSEVSCVPYNTSVLFVRSLRHLFVCFARVPFLIAHVPCPFFFCG